MMNQRRLIILSQQILDQTRCLENSPCLAKQDIVVIGGMIMDLQVYTLLCILAYMVETLPPHSLPTPFLQAQPLSQTTPGGSVPGKIKQIPGGVGRNIAHSIGNIMQGRLLFISVVADDPAGHALLTHWHHSCGFRKDGILSIHSQHGSTPTVMTIFDANGDIKSSVADLDLLEKYLDRQLVLKQEPFIQAAPFIVLDGNMHLDSLQVACQLAHKHRKPVWFEPVSATKAKRAVNMLQSITYISPNEQELESLAIEVVDGKQQGYHIVPVVADNNKCISFVHRQLKNLSIVLSAGVQYIILTGGKEGAAACCIDPHDSSALLIYMAPALEANVVNCSGAGDTLVAGCISALVHGRSIEAALKYGIAAAKYAVESSDNVPTLNMTMIEQLSKCVDTTLYKTTYCKLTHL